LRFTENNNFIDDNYAALLKNKDLDKYGYRWQYFKSTIKIVQKSQTKAPIKANLGKKAKPYAACIDNASRKPY